MRSVLLSLTLLALVAPAAQAAPRAKARLVTCHTSPAQAEREATFEGDVRALPGASRLQMRFVLEARTTPLEKWAKVAAPGFGMWNTAVPGIGRYVYTKRVEQLVAPARYRAVVHFRWTDARGKVIERARRTTPTCVQPDLRPDLAPVVLSAVPGGYEVVVHNAGATAAGAFSVVLEHRGVRTVLGDRLGLAAGSRTTVRGEAEPCTAGETLVVRIESGGADERNPSDDTLTVGCPAPGP